MIRRVRLLGLALAFVCSIAALSLLSIPSAFAQSDPDQVSPCDGTRLRDIKPCMQSFVEDGSILGLVTLVDRKGLPLQLDAVGSYKKDSIFQIMSMTKPFVSVGIMILVERGKIPSVDSKVSDLPGFRDFPYRDITIKQLLTHTSGMWIGTGPFLPNKLDKAPEITVRDKSLEFVARHYADPGLYPLGPTSPQYSNAGYIMLGWIIERLSEQPLTSS